MKETQEFKERKALIELKQNLAQEKHQLTMVQLMYQRKTNDLNHEQQLERMRIKSAEIKKSQQRKAFIP